MEKANKELEKQLQYAYNLCLAATDLLGNVIASGESSADDRKLYKGGKSFIAFYEKRALKKPKI